MSPTWPIGHKTFELVFSYSKLQFWISCFGQHFWAMRTESSLMIPSPGPILHIFVSFTAMDEDKSNFELNLSGCIHCLNCRLPAANEKKIYCSINKTRRTYIRWNWRHTEREMTGKSRFLKFIKRLKNTELYRPWVTKAITITKKQRVEKKGLLSLEMLETKNLTGLMWQHRINKATKQGITTTNMSHSSLTKRVIKIRVKMRQLKQLAKKIA